MKRIAAPRSYPITRKIGGRFVTDPAPGPHSKNECVPLSVLVRNLVGITDSSLEAKALIKAGKIKIDGVTRKDHKFPTGLFDTIEFADESYRIVLTKSGFRTEKIDKKEIGKKLCKIIGKKTLKEGKTQLNLNDGKNIAPEKGSFSTGDSIIVSIPEMKIQKHIGMKEGAKCIITRGKNRSSIATFKKLEKVKGSGPNLAVIELDGTELKVPEEIVFIIGEKESEITVA